MPIQRHRPAYTDVNDRQNYPSNVKDTQLLKSPS